MSAVGRIAAAPLPTAASADASAAGSGEDGAAFGSILSQMGGDAKRSDTAASVKSSGGAHRGEKDGREARVQDGKAGPHRRGLHERMIGGGGDAAHASHKVGQLPAEMAIPADSDTTAATQVAAAVPAISLAGMNAPPMPDEAAIDVPERALTKEVAGAIAHGARSGSAAASMEKIGDGLAGKDTHAPDTKAVPFQVEARVRPQAPDVRAQSLPDTPAAAPPNVTVLGRETHLAPARPAGLAPVRPEADETDDAVVTRDSWGKAAKSQGLPPELHATKVPAVGKGTDGAVGDHDAPAQAALATISTATSDGGGLPSAALHRIAGAIVETAGGSSSPVAVATAVPSAPVAASGPVKVLTVRLDLADRGALDVRMIADGSALTIHVRTEKDETARHLHNDRDELTSLLRGAGYDANIATIESRRADAGPAPSGQPAAPGPASTPNGYQGGGAFQEPRQQGREGGTFPFSDQRETSHDTSKPDSRGAGLLYV
jgi:hypothetical protein